MNYLEKPIRQRQMWIDEKNPRCVIALLNQLNQSGVSNGGLARTTPTDCNAVSIGVTFHGTRMRIAPENITPGLPLVNICATDGGLPSDAGPGGSDAGPPDAGVLDAP